MISPSALVDRQLVIGEGFFGTVYRATYNHAYVAVKTTSIRSSDGSSSEKERKMLGSIPPHPNVLHAIAVCIDATNASVSIVSEYCANGNVRSYIEKKLRSVSTR